MKRTIVALVFLSAGLLSRAQNKITVDVADGLCVSEVIFDLSDNSMQYISPGCAGTYDYDLGSLSLLAVSVNGVVCREGEIKDVVVDGGAAARVGYKGSRIKFGGGTVSSAR